MSQTIMKADVAETDMRLKGDYIGTHLQRFQDAESADHNDRLRGLDNLRRYAPTTSWDAWPYQFSNQFAKQDRKPNNYNFQQMYVEGHASNFISTNTVDPKFVDNEADNKDSVLAIQALQDVWYSDKDYLQYNKSHNDAVLNGCIYRGLEEIRINRTVEDPLGRIGFESLSPTTVIFDPTAVYTDDMALESREAWKRFYLYPEDLARMFPELAEHIRGFQYGTSNFASGYNYTDVPEDYWWQNKVMIVEWFHIVTEEVEVAYDKGNNSVLPETPYSFGSEDDFQGKFEWSKKMGYQLNPANIVTFKKEIESLYVTTFCPTLALTLQNKKDERQLYDSTGKSRLPFFVWAYSQKNGKTFGVIDVIKDAQDDINKRDAARTKYMVQTPFNKIIVHPLAYGEDMAKRNDITKNLNDPASPVFLDADSPPNMPLIHTLQGINVNPALLQDEQFKMQLMDRITSLPAAMQGLTGKSGESGVLHTRKVIEGSMMTKMRATRLIEYQNAKFNAWAQLAPGLYGGKTDDERFVNQNRTFIGQEGKPVVANEIAGFSEDGSPIIIKDLSELKRVNVIITETKENDYQKQMNREVNIALSQAMGPVTPQNMAYKAILDKSLTEGIDELSPEDKKKIQQVGELSVSNALKSLQLQSVQLDMQLTQMQGPQQPQVPGSPPTPEQSGIPGGQPAIPPELTSGAPLPGGIPAGAPIGQGV